MNEIVGWVLSAIVGALAAIPVVQWRVSRLETDREKDEVAGTKSHDQLWAAIHEGERTMASHEKKALENLLEIEKRFGVVLVAQAQVGVEIKGIAAGIDRLETKVDNITEEVKRS